jgi:hypothetical protein
MLTELQTPAAVETAAEASATPTAETPSYFDKARAQYKANIAAAKAAIFAELQRRAVNLVVITYDGQDDGGQIDEISYQGAPGGDALEEGITLALWDTDNPRTYDTMREALDDFAWYVLQNHHYGFENNSGGYGELTINVTASFMLLDHYERITDTNNTESEI